MGRRKMSSKASAGQDASTLRRRAPDVSSSLRGPDPAAHIRHHGWSPSPVARPHPR